MTRPRAQFLPDFLKSRSSGRHSSSTLEAPFQKLYHKLIPEKKKTVHFECQYCFETKKSADFIQSVTLPYMCQHHLGTSSNRVCKKCLQEWLSAQLDCKTLLEIACPECSTPWDPEDVRYLVRSQDRKKLEALEEMAKEVTLVPDDLPEEVTTGFLLNSGARFW